MRQAATKIAELTHGVVDLVVLTHEHWDHVSGLRPGRGRAQEQADLQAPLGGVDGEAGRAAGRRAPSEVRQGQARPGARASRRPPRCGASTTPPSPACKLWRGFSPSSAPAPPGPSGRAPRAPWPTRWRCRTSSSTRRRTRSGRPISCPVPARRCQAPPVRPLGVQTFVLGPPHDRTKLLRMNPREKGDEAYEKKKGDAPGLGLNWAWLASAMTDGLTPASQAEAEVANLARSHPFDATLGIPLADAQRHPLLRALLLGRAGRRGPAHRRRLAVDRRPATWR